MSCSENKRSYTTYQNYLATKNQTGCCCYLVGPTGPPGPTHAASSSLSSSVSIPGGEGDILFKTDSETLNNAKAPYNLNWSTSNVFDISAAGVIIHSGLMNEGTIRVGHPSHGGEIQFMESKPSTHFVSLKAASSIGRDVTFTLPADFPSTDGSVLVGDINGELRWTTSSLGSSTSTPSKYLSPVIELSTLLGDASNTRLTPAADTYAARFLPPRSAMYNKITIGLVATSTPPTGDIQACVYVADNMNKDHTYSCIAQSTDVSIPSSADFSSEQTLFLPITFASPFSLTDTSGHLVVLKWKPADSLSPLLVAGERRLYSDWHGTRGWLYNSGGSAVPLSIDVSLLNKSNFTIWIRIS